MSGRELYDFAKVYDLTKDLIDDYWTDYLSHSNDPAVVTPSIPIVWFGNIIDYFNSEWKIVTIAINPSFYEFTENKKPPYSTELRFALDETNKDKRASLIEAYNNYFMDDHKPYLTFFSAFEKVLQCLPGDKKASYGFNDANNTAIHIDCKTALATKKIWSEVSNDVKEKLTNEALFNRLLNDVLKPNIILVSSKDYKCEIEKEHRYFDKSGRAYHPRYSYIIDNRLVIYGNNKRGTPFGAVAAEDEAEYMKKLIPDNLFKQYIEC